MGQGCEYSWRHLHLQHVGVLIGEVELRRLMILVDGCLGVLETANKAADHRGEESDSFSLEDECGVDEGEDEHLIKRG